MEIQPFVADESGYALLIVLLFVCGPLLICTQLKRLYEAMLYGRVEMRRRKKAGEPPTNGYVPVVLGITISVALTPLLFYMLKDTRIELNRANYYSAEAVRANEFYGLPSSASIFYQEYQAVQSSRSSTRIDTEGGDGNLGYALAEPGKLIPIGTVLEEEANIARSVSYAMRYDSGSSELKVFEIGPAGELVELEGSASSS